MENCTKKDLGVWMKRYGNKVSGLFGQTVVFRKSWGGLNALSDRNPHGLAEGNSNAAKSSVT